MHERKLMHLGNILPICFPAPYDHVVHGITSRSKDKKQQVNRQVQQAHFAFRKRIFVVVKESCHRHGDNEEKNGNPGEQSQNYKN